MTDAEKSWIHENYFSSYKNSPLLKIQNKESFLNLFYRIITSETDTLEKKANMTQILAMLIKDSFPDIIEGQEYSDAAHQIKDYIDAGNGFGMQLEEFEKFFFQSKFYLEKKV